MISASETLHQNSFSTLIGHSSIFHTKSRLSLYSLTRRRPLPAGQTAPKASGEQPPPAVFPSSSFFLLGMYPFSLFSHSLSGLNPKIFWFDLKFSIGFEWLSPSLKSSKMIICHILSPLYNSVALGFLIHKF